MSHHRCASARSSTPTKQANTHRRNRHAAALTAGLFHGKQASYKQLDFIGEGAFAKVYICHRSSDSKEFAVKVFDPPYPDDDAETIQYMQLCLSREVHYLEHLRHPGVVQLVDTACPPPDNRMHIVMEKMQCTLLEV